MNWTELAANLAFLGVPPLSCVWAWWLWIRDSGLGPIPRWRRVATVIGLISVTVSIALGAFALLYWRHFPGDGHAPPDLSRIATMSGFALVMFGVPLSLLAKLWLRIAMVLCCLGLLGFYFGMFVAP